MPAIFKSMAELRKALAGSDVEIVDDDGDRTELNRHLQTVNRNVLENAFFANWGFLGGVELTREYRFHPTRKWRFDFAHPPTQTAFEIMGGLYQAQSGHRSKDGVSRDYEKANAGQSLGWRIYAITAEQVRDADYITWLITELNQRITEKGKEDAPPNQ